MTYNVLLEKWIPVIDLNEHSCYMSPLDVLKSAHQLSRISTGKPMFDFSLLLFLETLSMDALHETAVTGDEDDPDSVQTYEYIDTKRMMRNGQFTEKELERIDNYIHEKERTMSFDLFDKEKPFMQIWGPLEELSKEREPVSVAYSSYEYETKTTALVFHHTLEADRTLTKKEFIQNLCLVWRYVLASGNGWKSSVRGDSLRYYYAVGDNLFETLVLNIIPDTRTTHIAKLTGRYCYGEPYWTKMDQVIPDQYVNPTDLNLLEYLTFPSRMFRGVLDEQGQVVKLFQMHGFSPDIKPPNPQPGDESKKKKESTPKIGNKIMDPYKFYRYNIQSQLYRQIKEPCEGCMWTSIASLITDNRAQELKDKNGAQLETVHQAEVIRNAAKMSKNRCVRMAVLAVKNDRRKMFFDTRSYFNLPKEFFSDDPYESENLRMVVISAVNKASTMADATAKAQRQIAKTKSGDSQTALKHSFTDNFMLFLDRLAAGDDPVQVESEFLSDIRKKCLEAFDTSAEHYHYSAEERISTVIKHRWILNGNLKKIMG